MKINQTFKQLVVSPFLNCDNVNLIREKYKNQKLVFFGGTGSICQSFAIALSCLDVKPLEIIVISKNPENDVYFSLFYNSITRHISLDLSKPNAIKSINDKLEGSYVFYFAGYGQPQLFSKTPEILFDLNITTLLEFKNIKLKELYFASTTELYTGVDTICTEDIFMKSHPQHPRGIYIEAKRSGESICHHILSKSFKTVSFRIALAFPPVYLSSDTRVLSDLLKSGLNGNVILNGGTNLVRQYQYGPHSAMKMLIASVNSKESVYNIAGSYIYTLGELAKEIASFLKVKYTIKEEMYDTSSPNKVLISMSRFNDEFGFNESNIPSLSNILTYHLEKESIC